MLLHHLQSVDFILTGIACRHIKQLHLVATLRYGKCSSRHRSFRSFRYYNFIILYIETISNLCNRIIEQLGYSLVKTPLILQSYTPHDSSTPHVHIIYIHLIGVVIDPKHVDIIERLAYNHTLRLITVDKHILLLYHLCFLKTKLHAQPFHLAAQIIEQFLSIAAEYLLYMVNHLSIFSFSDATGTASHTVLEMKLQTQPTLSLCNIGRGDGMSACAHRIQFTDKIEHSLGNCRVGIWPEIFRAVLQTRPCKKHPWIRLFRHHNPRIGFVILEKYIIMRLVLFYE